MTPSITTRRFPFARPGPIGALPGLDRWARVEVDEREMRVRFGLLRLDVPREEIAGVDVTGPYSPLKALGVRLSLADGGLTLGTSAAAGVCVRFTRPRRGVDPFGLLRHPGLTVTVADPHGLAEALTPDGGAHS
jgi:hypothetical protein